MRRTSRGPWAPWQALARVTLPQDARGLSEEAHTSNRLNLKLATKPSVPLALQSRQYTRPHPEKRQRAKRVPVTLQSQRDAGWRYTAYGDDVWESEPWH